jgi:hypothetical protein
MKNTEYVDRLGETYYSIVFCLQGDGYSKTIALNKKIVISSDVSPPTNETLLIYFVKVRRTKSLLL